MTKVQKGEIKYTLPKESPPPIVEYKSPLQKFWERVIDISDTFYDVLINISPILLLYPLILCCCGPESKQQQPVKKDDSRTVDNVGSWTRINSSNIEQVLDPNLTGYTIICFEFPDTNFKRLLQPLLDIYKFDRIRFYWISVATYKDLFEVFWSNYDDMESSLHLVALNCKSNKCVVFRQQNNSVEATKDWLDRLISGQLQNVKSFDPEEIVSFFRE